MKKLVVWLFVLVIVAVGGIVALPFMIPMDTYKAQIIKQVKERTGRELVLAGDISVSIYPTLGVKAEKVTLMNPAGFTRKEMMSLEALNVSVELLPLLKKEVIIKQFDLDKPKVYLEKNGKGKGNWEFTQQKAESPIQDTMEADTSAALSPAAFRLGTINITGGVFEWKDAATGTLQQLKDVYLSLMLESLNSPFELDVKALWKDKHVNFLIALSNLADALAGKSTGFNTELNTPLLTFSYDGKAYAKRDKGGVSYHSNGKVALETDSLVEFGKWVGQPIDLGAGNKGKLSLNGALKLINNVFALKDASVSFDAIDATGNFTIDVGRKVPYFAGMLSTNVLDFNPFLPPQAKDMPKQENADAASKEWSKAPYDFDWLRSFEADLHLTSEGILYRDIKVGKTSLSTALKTGKLVLSLKEMALYDGQGSGEVSVDARGETPVIDKFFVLEGVQAEPLLKDALQIDRLSGKADATIRLKGAGRSQYDLVGSLNGGGKFTFADGALKGHNIAQTVRNFQMKITGGEKANAEATDFAELSASFTVNNGVFNNSDLVMMAPLLRVTGKGSISLLNRQINYGLVAKLVNSLKGQGGKEDKKGIPIPIRVTGSFDAPEYSLDIGSMALDALQNPESIKETVDTVKEVGKDIKNQYKDIKDTVKGLKGLLGN